MKAKFFTLLLIALLAASAVKAQSVAMGPTLFTPDAKAILELRGDGFGFLIPRMAWNLRPAGLTAAQEGLLFYSTDGDGINGPGYYYWDGTQWKTFGGSGGGGTSIGCGTSLNTNYTVRGTGSGNWACTDALQISSTGYVAINTTPSSSYNLRIDGNVGIGYAPSSSYTLSVDGSAHFPDYVGIGTTPSSSYDLRVYGNIGVGTSPSSSYELSVSGQGYFTSGVGVGTTPPTSGLYVGGSSNFYVPTSITTTSTAVNMVISSGRVYRYSSSRRYKDNISEMSIDRETMDKVLKLRPVTFTCKSTGKQDFGLIAEEVETLLPDLVIYEAVPLKDENGNILTDKDGLPVVSETEQTVEGVKYDRISLYLLKIIADQEKRIQELEKIVGSMQK